MSALNKTLLCFQAPKPSAYIGGIVTLCNDYIDKRELFLQEGIEISCFNYEISQTSIWNKISYSPLRNIVYGWKQINALKKLLHNQPETNIHIHTSRKSLFFKDVLLARAIRKFCKRQVIMTIHVGDIQTVFHNTWTQKFLIRMMNQSVDTVLFLSERMRKQFIHVGLEEERTKVLYNFFNINPVAPSEKMRCEIPQITYLGSINREKGIIELLTALNNIGEKFHFNLCGTIIEADLKSEIERLSVKLGDKITYHGYVGKEKKQELLKKTDILVLPSYREGMPISIIEAMATSCGITTTPVGAIPEILTEDNALIVEPKDSDALKQALLTLLRDSNLLDAMQNANYAKSQLFSGQQHIHTLCQVYKQQPTLDSQN